MALVGSAMDVAVERNGTDTTFSHNALLSGRGNKGVGPEFSVRAEASKHVTGKFTLVPLDGAWPAALTRWLGRADQTVRVEKPFARSYDQ